MSADSGRGAKKALKESSEMTETLLQRVWTWLHDTFPERQIYIRSDGRVQFFTFGPSLQATLAGLTLIFLGWVAFATVNVIFKDRIIAANDHRYQQMQSAYENRMAELQRELEAMGHERRTQRARRQEREGLARVALVGYTNAGKSTLMRALTGSAVLVANKLFATLDTTVRALHPESVPRILVSDTVGFIKNLPHGLVASFKSTLDEALEASLLLHVVDASDPGFERQRAVTEAAVLANPAVQRTGLGRRRMAKRSFSPKGAKMVRLSSASNRTPTENRGQTNRSRASAVSARGE